MTVIFEKRFNSTLEQLLTTSEKGSSLEIWSFNDQASRKAAEQAFERRGVSATIRSAYKPLVYAFLEEIDLQDVSEIKISYPVHEAAPENRFRLEAYPIAAMVGERKLTFTPRDDNQFHYDVKLTTPTNVRTLRVLAPNHVHKDIIGQVNLSPTGWIIKEGMSAGERLVTDYEVLYNDTMNAIASHAWGDKEPYFEELNVTVRLPAEDEELEVGDEVISLREALHEDIYFSLLEFFQHKSGRPSGDRGLKPGQIVPEIIYSNSEISVSITLDSLNSEMKHGVPIELEKAPRAIPATQVSVELDNIGGVSFQALSRSGRVVDARYIKGNDAPVMISGGQHANETTGVIGALRAAHSLRSKPNAHFTISPLENPDGYSLHQRLITDNPRHMHHAARYTALGDDLEYRTEENSGENLNEKKIRFEAQTLSQAQLHVNLHGYPSHEWTRPLSGYVPRHFAMWTVPKGFFLIMRYLEGWENKAELLLDRVTKHLGSIRGLLDYNNKQIGLYEIHAGETGFRIINGFPCLISQDDRHTVPLTLITEYPDETIYGDAFIAGHTAQMETVLSAYETWQDIITSDIKVS